MKNIHICLAALGAAFLFSSCSTEAAYKVSNNLTAPYLTDSDHQKNDDKAVTGRLQEELDDNIPGNAIKVVVNHFNVLLVGQVKSSKDKETAASICEQFPSIKQVFNYLIITALPKLNTNAGLAKQAKYRLEEQSDVNGDSLSVVAVDGVVYIIGTNVGNLKAYNQAINQGIYSISGVRKVVSLEEPGPEDYYPQ